MVEEAKRGKNRVELPSLPDAIFGLENVVTHSHLSRRLSNLFNFPLGQLTSKAPPAFVQFSHMSFRTSVSFVHVQRAFLYSRVCMDKTTGIRKHMTVIYSSMSQCTQPSLSPPQDNKQLFKVCYSLFPLIAECPYSELISKTTYMLEKCLLKRFLFQM